MHRPVSQLPGYCPECHALFPAPLSADGPTDVTFFDIPVRCARCEASGHIPADVREWIGQVAVAVRSVPAGARAPVAAALDACREEGLGPEACRERLRTLETDAPGLEDLFRRMDYQELGFAPLVAAAGVAVLRLADDEGETVEGLPREELVNRALDRTLEDFAIEPPPDRGPSESERRLAETGRNEPCPCGSGDKYKDCHWIEDQRESRG